MSEKRLSYFLFDGSVQKPTGNFANVGAGAVVDGRENFLKKLKDDRIQRENERKREISCKVIQSWWRGSLQRSRSKKTIRAEYDENLKNYQQDDDAKVLKAQIIRLFYFFNGAVDGERLIWMCQNVLKISFFRLPLSNEQVEKKILTCCIKYLSHIASTNLPIALPLRCIETYFKLDKSSIVVVKRLIDEGYFKTFKKLIDAKTPSDLSEETSKAPTHLADNIFAVLLYPLIFASKSKDLLLKRKVFQNFLSSFFCTQLSPGVRFYVLPALCASGHLKFDDFSSAFDGVFAFNSKSVELAFSVVYLMSNCPTERIETKLNCPIILSTVLPPLLKMADTREKHLEEDDGETEKMEVDEFPDDSYVKYTLKLLNSKNMFNILLAFVHAPKESIDGTAFNSFVFLCHFLVALKDKSFVKQKILFSLSFKPNYLSHLWERIVSCTVQSITGPRRLIEILQRGNTLKEEDRLKFLPMLSVFCALFSNLLLAVDDEEFYRDNNFRRANSLVPFTLSEMAAVSSVLRDVAVGLIELALPDARPYVNESYKEVLIDMGADFSPQNTAEWNRLFESVVRLLILLHDRDERLQFCPIGHWCVRNRITLQNSQMFRRGRGESNRRLFGVARYMTRSELEDKKEVLLSSSELRTLTILRKIPFLVPFEERVTLLYQLTLNDQHENGRVGVWTPGLNLHVRRNYLYEDSFDKLAFEQASKLKSPLRIMMANWAGAEEAGIDGGGIFREFLTELLKTGFDPSRGFFTTSFDQLLYPNPLAKKIFPDTYRRHYNFLGRMLGKMIYENQLAELPFARFFLSKLLSRHRGDVDVHHLSSLDPILHKNLISLKYMDTGVSELYLDFTVMVEEFGEVVTIPLVPNGNDILVTTENRMEYVQLVADFYLNKQIKEQTDSFREGIADMIDLDWLQMFDYRELQILISGVDRSLDVDDLRRNTKYVGEGTEDYIALFWQVVESLTDDQKRKLLKFVTGCSRPPLLGFKDLYPQFTIQIVPAEQKRLPTAATCMNLLKLPRFDNEATLRQKLTYAIESGAGFELS